MWSQPTVVNTCTGIGREKTAIGLKIYFVLRFLLFSLPGLSVSCLLRYPVSLSFLLLSLPYPAPLFHACLATLPLCFLFLSPPSLRSLLVSLLCLSQLPPCLNTLPLQIPPCLTTLLLSDPSLPHHSASPLCLSQIHPCLTTRTC